MRKLLSRVNPKLGNIIDKAYQLKMLNQDLAYYLEPALAAHCRVANYERGVLVIETDSAVWSTQLRYLTPELITKFRKEAKLYGLVSIKHYIKSYQHPPQKKSHGRVLSQMARENLKACVKAVSRTE